MLSYPRSLRSSLHKIVRACGGCAEWPTGSIIAHASASAADGPAANVRNQASSLCDLANDFKLIKQFKGFHRARIDQAAPGFVQCVLKHRFAAHMGGIEPAIARASPGSLRFKLPALAHQHQTSARRLHLLRDHSDAASAAPTARPAPANTPSDLRASIDLK